MKRFLAFCLIFCLLFSLTACGKKEAEPAKQTMTGSTAAAVVKKEVPKVSETEQESSEEEKTGGKSASVETV